MPIDLLRPARRHFGGLWTRVKAGVVLVLRRSSSLMMAIAGGLECGYAVDLIGCRGYGA